MEQPLVKQAVLRHLAATRPTQVPCDPIDFLNRARVTFLDPYGRVIEIGAATITWEE